MFVVSFIAALLFCFFVSQSQAAPAAQVDTGPGTWFEKVFGFMTSNKQEKSSNKVPSLSDSDVAVLFEDAKDLLQKGSIQQALDNLLPIIQSRPDHQETNAFLGAILLSIQQLELAEDMLYAAVGLSRWTDVSSVINLAVLLGQKGEYDLALRTLFKAYNASIADDSNISSKAKLSLSIADMHYALGNYSAASEWYLSTAMQSPDSIDTWIKASTIRYPKQAVNYKFAENVLLQAISLNSNSADLVFHMGLVLYGTNRVVEAITFYEQALRLNEQNNEALSALATAFHSLNRWEEALHYYQIAIERMPENALLHANFARLLDMLGDKANAARLLQRANSLQPSNPEIVSTMAELGERVAAQ